jgi:hypothetical protein
VRASQNAQQRTDETQTKQDMTCRCSGIWGPYDMEIVDSIVVPDAPPGQYVISWRWDCEESTQIWQSCSISTASPSR